MTIARKRKTPPVYNLCDGSRLLALDVSSSAMGWAVVKKAKDGEHKSIDFNVVKPPSTWDFKRKMFRMMTTTTFIIDEYGVTDICMEWQDHRSTQRRVQGLAVLGQAQGALWNHLITKMKVDLIPVRDCTKIGGKNAKKEKRRDYVRMRVPDYAKRADENPRFDRGLDASDALFLALWRLDHEGEVHVECWDSE